MKVTYVVNALGEGGTERSLADLLPGLREAGIEVDIVTLRSRGDEGVEPMIRAQGFDVHTVGPVGAIRTLRTLRTRIRDGRPDIVHTMLFDANLYGRLASIGTGTRTVVSLVNTTYGAARRADPRLNRWKLRAVQAIDVTLARLRTDRFHAVSRAVKADAIAGLRVPADKITVIERGRRPETLPPPSPERRVGARHRLDIPGPAEVLVTVGRQEYQKGHRYLVSAMNELGDRRSLRLLVAGRTGNESPELQRLLAESPEIAARIDLLGHRSDVAEILAAADLFVFPSLFEGMPGALIEAMASGLPIVASDIEPVREVLQGEPVAVLVPPRDPIAMAGAIEDLLGDPLRRERMGRRSRELFEERFTMQRSIDAFLGLYRELTAGTAAPLGRSGSPH